MEMKLIWPASEDVEPPVSCRFNVDGKPIYRDIVDKWEYRNEKGELCAYVVKCLDESGNKITPQMTQYDCNGKKRWINKGMPRPRPLYGLELIAKYPTYKIILVEGEKCAYTLNQILPKTPNAPFIAVSWCGGVNSVRHANWEPLRGRSVLLWPDNDTPGKDAMCEIASILKSLGCKLKYLQPKTEWPEKYDVADMVLNDKATLRQVFDVIKAQCTEVPECKSRPKQPSHTVTGQRVPPYKAAPRPEKDTEWKDEPIDFVEAKENATFRFLGYNNGVYYYLPKATRQIVMLSASSHQQNNLFTLADREYWEEHFVGRKGIRWIQAVGWLIKTNSEQLFNPARVRGRGLWLDNNRKVLHLGDRLIVDGVQMGLDEIDSKFVYIRKEALEHIHAEPLDDLRAYRMIDTIEKLVSWENPAHAGYYAGWLVVALIGGATDWRPHVWLTGESGTGKSWINKRITAQFLGEFAQESGGNTTEAGLRQMLSSEALPVIIDEFEGETEESKKNQAGVIELSRTSSSSGGKITKGTPSGSVIEYTIQSSFYFSSIGVQLANQSDRSRITVCTLVDPLTQGISKETKIERFKQLRENVKTYFTPEICAAMRARVFKYVNVIIDNAKVYADAIVQEYGSSRLGDQLGMLYAGLRLFRSTELVSFENAVKDVKMYKENDTEQSDDIKDMNDTAGCLATILSTIVRCYNVDTTFLNIIKKIVESTSEVPVDEEEKVLAMYSIKVTIDKQYVAIVKSSTQAPNLRMKLKNTKYSECWGRTLSRLPDATEKLVRINKPLRCICIPMNQVICEETASGDA